MGENISNKHIIELNFDRKEKSFSKKLLNEITLERISNSHSPYIEILKVFFGILLALLSDKYITKNPDSVSSAFTAILCISPIVTRGIKSCTSTFLMCFIGAVVSTLGNIICGVETSTIWRVPIGTAITYYFMFLCHMEDNVGGLSAGAFSAIFVQLTLFEYTPLISHNQSEWLNTLIVRLLSVLTGCVSSLIVNFFFDIVYYKFFFKTKICNFTKNITLYLHDFVNEPENYFLEYHYQILNDLIMDIDYANNEINFLLFHMTNIIQFVNSINELEHYKNLLYSYLRLLNHLSFLGYQKENMTEEEIESVKKVVKYCIMKLYSHQYQIKEKNLVGFGYIESPSSVKNSQNVKNESRDFLISEESSDITNNLINIEDINLNIINNEKIEDSIQESLRIPLKAVLQKTDIIINALYNCKILKN